MNHNRSMYKSVFCGSQYPWQQTSTRYNAIGLYICYAILTVTVIVL